MSAFVDLSSAQVDALVGRIEQAIAHDLALSQDDLKLLLQALLTLAQLQEQLQDQTITLHKLRKLAGLVASSEKLRGLMAEASEEANEASDSSTESTPSPKPPKVPKPPKAPKPPKPPVIHQRCTHSLTEFRKGQCCPDCERGKLYKYQPSVVLRITGQTPLVSTQHIRERLRCNACGQYFTAPLPEAVLDDGPPEQTYGYSARAVMGLNKYFAGLPFYRQQTLQQLFGFPVAASVVFDQCEALADAIRPVFVALRNLAAEQGVLFYLDDTTHRIVGQGPVLKPDRRSGKLKERTGIYTSGVIAELPGGSRCVLYQTNVGYAGEWLDEILRARPPTAPVPIIMADALSSNRPSVLSVYHMALCNAHARREFVDLTTLFPDLIPTVLEPYGKIWAHEHECQKNRFTPAQRLAYHRQHSLPVMKQLRTWGQQQLEQDLVEANSRLGQAIGYFERHFDNLTAFCRIEGAPIDNNLMEQALKLIIRGRKNALFFRSEIGAAINDVICSVSATAYQAGVNVFDYLVCLQRHAQEVHKQPQLWLPWNYRDNLDERKKAA